MIISLLQTLDEQMLEFLFCWGPEMSIYIYIYYLVTFDDLSYHSHGDMVTYENIP